MAKRLGGSMDKRRLEAVEMDGPRIPARNHNRPELEMRQSEKMCIRDSIGTGVLLLSKLADNLSCLVSCLTYTGISKM